MAAGRIVLSQYFPARDRNGRLVSGALLYVYTNGTTTKASIFSNEGLTTSLANPVAANSSGQFPAIWASDAVTYTLSITGPDGESIGNPSVFDDYSVSTDAEAAAVALAEAAAATAEASEAAIAALLEASGTVQTGASVTFIQEGTGAVATDAQAKARESVSLADFRDADDAETADATYAFVAAAAAHPQDQILFPAGETYANPVLDESCVGIRGRIGAGETGAGGVNALRPFDITEPTVTVGGGASPAFNNTLRDILISGHKTTGQEAPAALRLTAGVSHFSASNLEIIGGTISLDCLPDDGQPVTCSWISHFHIRNDIAGSSARAIKFTRTGSDGEYFTGFSMHQGHVNGPNGTGSYALEIDGSVVGITASFVDVYFDCKPDKGVLLLGSSLLLGFNLQLDPGTNGVVVVKTDQASRDPCDYLSGNIRHGGQDLKNGLDQITSIPADTEWFFRYAALRNTYLSGLTYISTNPADRFSQSVYLTAVSTNGPVGLYGAPFWAMDATNPTNLASGAFMTQGGAAIAKDIRVGGTWYGYSGSTVAMTQEPSGAGWRVDIAQAGGSYRITPGAGGYFIIAGAGIYPSADNAQTLGLPGNAFTNVVGVKHSDGAGLQVVGARKTGWAVDTGTAKRTANATYSGTAEGAYTQATIQALMDAVRDLSQTVKALKDDLHATAGHGLIGT